MTEAIDPISASTAIVATYRRYLGSLLPLHDEALLAGIHTALAQPRGISRGPLLEATPPFRAGATLDQLVSEGVLNSRMRRLFSPALPGSRPLYFHQESAIRKAVSGRNLVITTGTGSGKTECFLIPILNSLLRRSTTGHTRPASGRCCCTR